MSEPRLPLAAALATRTALAGLLYWWLLWLAPDPANRFASPAMLAWIARAALLLWVDQWTTRRVPEPHHQKLWWTHRTVELLLLAAILLTNQPHDLNTLTLHATTTLLATQLLALRARHELDHPTPTPRHRGPWALPAWRARVRLVLAGLWLVAGVILCGQVLVTGTAAWLVLVISTVIHVDVACWLTAAVVRWARTGRRQPA